MAMLKKRQCVIGYLLHNGSNSLNVYKCEECQCYFPTIKLINEHFKPCVDSLNALTCSYGSKLRNRPDEKSVKSLKSRRLEQIESCRSSLRNTECITENKAFRDNSSKGLKRKHGYLLSKSNKVISKNSLGNKESTSSSFSDDDFQEIDLTSECPTIDENEKYDRGQEVYSCTGRKNLKKSDYNTLFNSNSIETEQFLATSVENTNDSLLSIPSAEIGSNEFDSISMLHPSETLVDSKYFQNSSGISQLAGRGIAFGKDKLDNKTLTDNLHDKHEPVHSSKKETFSCELVERKVPSRLISTSNYSCNDVMTSTPELRIRKPADNVCNETLSSSNTTVYIKSEESGECIASIDISSVNAENKIQVDEGESYNIETEQILTVNELHKQETLDEDTSGEINANVSKFAVKNQSLEQMHFAKDIASKSLQGKKGSVSIIEKEDMTFESNNDGEMIHKNYESSCINELENILHEKRNNDGTLNACPGIDNLSDSLVDIKCEDTGKCTASVDTSKLVSQEIVNSLDKANQNEIIKDDIDENVINSVEKEKLQVKIWTKRYPVDVSVKNSTSAMQECLQSTGVSNTNTMRIESDLESKDTIRGNTNRSLSEKANDIQEGTNIASLNKGNRYSFRKRTVRYYGEDDTNEDLDNTHSSEFGKHSHMHSSTANYLKKNSTNNDHNDLGSTSSCRSKTKFKGTIHHSDTYRKDLEDKSLICGDISGSNEPCHSCNKCDTQFSSTNCYINHLILYHHPAFTRKDLTMCPICNLSYDSYFNSKLRLHMTKRHSLDEMKCLCCNSSFDTSVDLQKHIVVCGDNGLSGSHEGCITSNVQCLKCKCFHIYKPSDHSDDVIKEILQTLPKVNEINLLRVKFDTLQKKSHGHGTLNLRCLKCNRTFEKIGCAVNHVVLFHLKDTFVECPMVHHLTKTYTCGTCKRDHTVAIERRYKMSYIRKLRFHVRNDNLSSKLLEDSLNSSDRKFFKLIKDGLVKFFSFDDMKTNEGNLKCKECNIATGGFMCSLNHIVKNHFDIASKNIFLQAKFVGRKKTFVCSCSQRHGFVINDRKLFDFYLARAFDQTIDDESFSQQDEEPSVETNSNLKKLKEYIVLESYEFERELLNVSSVKIRTEISKEMVYRIVHINGFFYCQFCHSGFKQISCCKNHVLTEHCNFFMYQKGSDVYTCLKCKKYFHRLCFLSNHMEKCHNIYTYICVKCDEKFNPHKFGYDHFKHCKGFVKSNGNEQLVCEECGHIHNCIVHDKEEDLIKSYSSGNETIFKNIRNNQTKLTEAKVTTSYNKTISKVSSIEGRMKFDEDTVNISDHDGERGSHPNAIEGSKPCAEMLSTPNVEEVPKSCIENFASSYIQKDSTLVDKEPSSCNIVGSKPMDKHHLRVSKVVIKSDGTEYSNSDIANPDTKDHSSSDMTKAATRERYEEDALELQTIDNLNIDKEERTDHDTEYHTNDDRQENVELVNRGLPIVQQNSSKQDIDKQSDVAFDGTHFFCLICLEKFEELTCCSTHVLMYHNRSISFTCSICFQATNSKFGYISHLKNIHGLYSCYCKQCMMGFEDVNLRDKHKTNCESTKRKNTDSSNGYACKKCSLVHVHVSNRKVSCLECELGFASISCAKNHFYTKHFPPLVILSSKHTVFRCLCKKVFLTKAELQSHLLTEHRPTSNESQGKTCALEEYQSSSDIDYDSYFKIFADRKCVGCEHFHIIDSKELKVIDRIETTCKLCKATFLETSCLKNHILNSHRYKNEMRQCVGCGLYCVGSEALERHQKCKHVDGHHKKCKEAEDSNEKECRRSVSLLKCDKCGEMHQHKFMLEESKIFDAKSPQEIREERSKKAQDLFILKSRFICYFCDLEVDSHRLLKEHNKRYHKKIKDKKGDFCQVCKKQVGCNLYYSEHLMQEHCSFKFVHGELLNDFARNFSCLYCEETFSFAIDAQMHLRLKHFENPLVARKHFTTKASGVVAGQRNQHCPLCLKPGQVNISLHLDRHFIRSKKLEQYVCDVCGKIYKYMFLYKEHINKHTGTRKYKCKICDKSFLHSTNLSTHMLVHKEKSEKCKECGMMFTLPHHLRAHMKRKHP